MSTMAQSVRRQSLGQRISGGRIKWSAQEYPSLERRREQYLSIGDTSRRLGLTPRALRFYESKGLIRPLREGQTRLYSARDIVRLELIMKGKQLGFTLLQITAMLKNDEEGNQPDLSLSRDQILGQIEFLERQFAQTERALAELRRRYYLMSELSENA